jgi:hypothetical protein
LRWLWPGMYEANCMRHGLVYNAKYFWWCLRTLHLRQARSYHSAQVALYGWRYLWGVRELKADWEKRYKVRACRA